MGTGGAGERVSGAVMAGDPECEGADSSARVDGAMS